jgi:hypothetical protein
MNCLKFALATALVLSFGIKTAGASPVVIGDPAKGSHITTLKDDDGSKVEITTTGIRIDEGNQKKTGAKNSGLTVSGDEDGDSDISIDKGGIKVHGINKTEKLEDIVVPVAFFLFLLAAALGTKYISSRNEQRRLDLLRAMVDKGQPVPEAVVNSIIAPQAAAESGDSRQTYKRYRNAYGFTIAGVALMCYAVLNHTYDGGSMIAALVFLCIGGGCMAGLYLPKQANEKISG